MEIDPTVVYGVFGAFLTAFIVFILNWARNLEKKTAEKCERRLTRLETIINVYFLKDYLTKDYVTMDYLEEVEEEFLGKNPTLKDVTEDTTIRSRSLRKKKSSLK